MKHVTVERLPDAKRIVVRLCTCFVPAFVFSFWLIQRHSRSIHRGAVPELIEFQRNFNALGILAVYSTATLIFVAINMSRRHLMGDSGAVSWLAIHGWQGDYDQAPQRGLLPFTELFGILAVSTAVETMAPRSLIFIPMVWSMARAYFAMQQFFLDRPYTLCAIVVLYASVPLSVHSVWIAAVLLLMATVLSEVTAASLIRSHVESLVNRDISFAAPPRTNRLRTVASGRQNSNENQKDVRWSPSWALRPDVEDHRLSRPVALTAAATVGWTVHCVLSLVENGLRRLSAHEPWMTSGIAMVLLLPLVILGFIRRVEWYSADRWGSRCGLRARVHLLRPIVWSWDRFWVMSLSPAMLPAACLFQLTLQLPSLMAGLIGFLAALLLMRLGPSPVEWQLTSDARLRYPQ